jgi:glycosyltransferase involved in cell wall biosynthesis
MHITAICPTYRRPKLIPGIVRMFDQQNYPKSKCRLIILDDGQTLETNCDGNTITVSRPTRIKTLGAKFREIVRLAIAHGTEAIALFEDDDIYEPGYLARHAEILANCDMSQSSSVWTDDAIPGQRIEVPAKGSHHGSWAFTVEAYERAGGYPADRNLGFDLTLAARFKRAGCAIGFGEGVSPYVYRWQTSGYPNGSGFGDEIYEAMEQ